eukprot:CAMPEP_0201527736 /NCGR_PEP_ID=MMETSP0161_2-20130828/36139_1 /ASSEMBLY_ACC=CAM_ASM_000251 /TAXON_ID=180227 /ORGANISM="Neoparamoeba aestuarina, Strain SoJaBio B1-5/56/2" /LENGTH=120 /DNA_ID=CAMNT_0047928677 /DNA_START=25 /DNA_END=384 /DNA_ORIENTATION=+
MSEQKLSHEKIAELMEAFRFLSGSQESEVLGAEELMTSLRRIGAHPEKDEETKFLEDVSGKQEIDFPTFACLMGQSLKNPELDKLISDSIDTIERELGHTVSIRELKTLLETKGHPLSEA